MRRQSLTMSAITKLSKVYLFKNDCDMIEELVRRRPTEETGGDLYGLWTNDGEPVLHVVTGNGRSREVQSMPRDSSSKDKESIIAKRQKSEKLQAILFERFHLSCIGKWRHSKLRSEEQAITEAVDQKYFLQEANCKGFVVILIGTDHPLGQVQFSPYLLSKEASTKGKCEILPGESVFKKDEDIKEIFDALVKKDDLETENKRNPENVGSKSPIKETLDDGKTEGSSDVEMKDMSSHRKDAPGWQTENIVPPRIQTNFACSQRDFKVYLFEEDQKMMEDLVLRCPDIETGGDLFGLWTTEGDVVLHIVLGPGQGCKRTDVSFYQDIPYLKRNGELLTQKYMLCHIGEWHSHHQLRLCRPSEGDSSTVIRNYPSQDTCGFLLIIANILSLTQRQVTLSPFLYTANSRLSFDLRGTIVPLRRYGNAFKKDVRIQGTMEDGMERERDYRPYQYSYASRKLTTGKVRNMDVPGAQSKTRSTRR